MTYYILKLVIMLPLMAGMIYAALWTYRKYQPGLGGAPKQRELKLVETLPMGTSGKLAIVEFGGQKILLSATRGQIQHIAATPMAASDTEADMALPEPAHEAPQMPIDITPFQNLMQRALNKARTRQEA